MLHVDRAELDQSANADYKLASAELTMVLAEKAELYDLGKSRDNGVEFGKGSDRYRELNRLQDGLEEIIDDARAYARLGE